MIRYLLFISFFFTQFACSRQQEVSHNQITYKSPTWSSKISKFSSCAEVSSYVQSFASDAGMANASEHFQNQVEGVNEGDILQMHPDFYFFARPGSIEIVDRHRLTQMRSIPVQKGNRRSLMYSEHRLVSIVGDYQNTWVQIFDEKNQFKMTLNKSFKGELVDFRLLDGHMTIVTKQNYIAPESFSNCSDIYRPNFEDGSSGITSVHRFPIQEASAAVESIDLWGSANFFYMTKQELFLFQTTGWGQVKSSFRVIDWSSGKLTFKQAEPLDEQIKDRTAVYQKNENLILATTFFNSSDLSNHLLNYKKNSEGLYRLKSASPDFGKREDIRAVHFLEDKAYVVTFEKTDPFFVIDIKNPEDMKILSELKSPGFSTQLYPMLGDLMVGIGFDVKADLGFSWFGGIKISLFNIENPAAPFEAGAMYFGARGSSSEATAEPKALLRSSCQQKFIVPIVHLEKNTVEGEAWVAAQKNVFSGAVLFEIQHGKLVEAGRYTHQNLREAVCGKGAYLHMNWWSQFSESLDIQRSAETLGHCFDTFSRFGVFRYCPGSDKPTTELAYKNDSGLCN